ncbi:winged helix-turn-helix transcriptional regulator [Pseudoduganella sp. LjRoot289]|uniref:helix-turn-helix transcriptional regulator n=1 Tax=Pseudoduganella sp. LjRoot289 TaxID=3342314 RepID=UPI003ED0A3A7
MLDMLGDRQKDLLRLLQKNKAGITVEQISDGLAITRSAVRQHIAALENEGLVGKGTSRATRGRPEQLYVLTDKGRECFPRHYVWFAQLLIESIQREVGADGMGERFEAMGTQVGQQLRAQLAGASQPAERLRQLSGLMQELGYDASVQGGPDANLIEADNCVFHNLAAANPHICKFDLALMSAFTEGDVEHQECMAIGGQVCRFKFRQP